MPKVQFHEVGFRCLTLIAGLENTAMQEPDKPPSVLSDAELAALLSAQPPDEITPETAEYIRAAAFPANLASEGGWDTQQRYKPSLN
jgi:hypothetical protein